MWGLFLLLVLCAAVWASLVLASRGAWGWVLSIPLLFAAGYWLMFAAIDESDE